MRSLLPSTVVIECPHCGTRYQVPTETIGPRGRQVQCAHCSRAWQANAVAGGTDHRAAGDDGADRLFGEDEERELDAAFAAAETAEAAASAGWQSAPPQDEPMVAKAPPDTADLPPPAAAPGEPPTVADGGAGRKRTTAFNRRRVTMARQQPLAQFRRMVRVAALVLLLGLVVGFIALRTEIVRVLPDLAGIYEVLGLGVNLVGLEFSDVATVHGLHNDSPALRVDARINNVAGRAVAVPPVVVSLLDAAGGTLYEWSVQPEAGELEAEEAVEFSTQLNVPPVDAVQVRLSFAAGRSQPEAPTAASETGTP